MYLYELPAPSARITSYSNGISDDQVTKSEQGFDYVAESDVTASKVFQPSQVGVGELIYSLEQFAEAARNLDRYKKALFRKRTRTESGLPTGFTSLSIEAYFTYPGGPPGITAQDIDQLMHGTVGLATESGELAEHLIGVLKGQTPDEVNVREEIGDCLWYIARLVFWAKTTFLAEMKRNIAKLRKRHGESGFSREGDINRDLEGERKLLEGDN